MSDKSINEVIDISNADVNGERIKAALTLIITAAVNVVNLFGYALDAEMWVNAGLTILSFVMIIYTWWKNQNITPEAAQAQLLLYALKEENRVAKHAAKENAE